MVLDDTSLSVFVTKGNPVIGRICAYDFHTVAQTACALEVSGLKYQLGQSVVLRPFVNAEFLPFFGCCKVAGKDMSVDSLDIAECQRTAGYDFALVEVAEVCASITLISLWLYTQ